MKKIDKVVMKSTSVVGGVCFVLMVAVIIANVFARLLVKKSFAWTEEIAYLLLNWSVFMGVCILFRNNALVAIDVLATALNPFWKKALHLFLYLLLTATNIGLTVWSLTIAMESWTGRTSPILGIPYFYYYIAVTVAGVILTGYSIAFFIKVVKNEELEETALEDRA